MNDERRTTGAAYRQARGDISSEVLSELETLGELPSLAGEVEQLTLQIIRERFEARFATDGEDEE